MSRKSNKQKLQPPPPPTPGGREKVTWIKVCIATNKCTISTKTSSLFLKMLKGQKKHIDKEQGKTKHEAPRSVNYRAIQNKNNIETTALERLVVYSTGGLKTFHCTNFTLGPDIILNTKKCIKKFGSHNGFLTQPDQGLTDG